MNTDDGNSSAILAIVAQELTSTETRLEELNRRSLNIIQYSVLLVGVTIIAADKHTEALVALPVFWNIWLLYAINVDHDTAKKVAYVEHLETYANEVLHSLGRTQEGPDRRLPFGYRLALRDSRSAKPQRESWRRNPSLNASQLIWVLLILCSTCIAWHALGDVDGHWRWLLIVYQAVVLIIVCWGLKVREAAVTEFRNTLKAITDGPTNSTGGCE